MNKPVTQARPSQKVFPLSPNSPVAVKRRRAPKVQIFMAIRNADDAMAHPCLAEAIRRRIIKIDQNRVTYTVNHEKKYDWSAPEEWVRAVTVAWLIIDREY